MRRETTINLLQINFASDYTLKSFSTSPGRLRFNIVRAASERGLLKKCQRNLYSGRGCCEPIRLPPPACGI